MKFTKIYITISILFCFLISYIGIAQDNTPVVTLGEKNITSDMPFVVTVVIKTTPEQPIPECRFPEFPDFSKRGFTKAIARSLVAGQPIVTYSISQNYLPKKEGTLKIKPFKLLVNNTEVKSEGCLVIVTKPLDNPLAEETETTSEDFTDFIEGNQKDLVNVKENAFFSLNTNKLNPFVGEGFTLTLAFYVAESNTADIQFDQNTTQIPAIIKKIKPESCWEESFGLTETQGESIKINGKNYMQYKFYQATFYPLNNKEIVIPSVNLRLLKDANSKEEGKKQSYVSFSTKPFVIKPKDLPPHPLKQQISVGVFTLKETVNTTNIATGKSIDYQIQISGDGNISEVKLPTVKNDSTFDFFQPDINSTISPQGNKIIGTKSFTFHIIPKQAGNFAMSKYFSWIYFNPQKGRYDTLRPKVEIHSSGKTINTVDTPTGESASIYDGLDQLNTNEEASNIIKLLKNEANIFIIIMLIGMVYIFLPNKKKRL